MNSLYKEYFSYKDNFKLTEGVSSIPVFESRLDFAPKFTIAIPTYKRADLLKEAVDSALNQREFDNFDVIVVDNNPERDCETERLMNSYTNPRLSYYKNSENLGMCGNWNRLYTLAKGEWVVMLHDDDLLLPSYLEVMDKVVNAYSDFSIVFPSYSRVKGDKIKELEISNFIEHNLRLEQIFERDFIFGIIAGPPVGMCVKKTDIFKSGGFSMKFYPSLDYDFYIRMAHLNKIIKISNNQTPLCIYRVEVNECAKIDTILKNIMNDMNLISIIYDKYIIFPRFIIKLYFVEYCVKYLREATFEFELKDINYETESKKLGINKSTRISKIVFRNFRRMRKYFFVKHEFLLELNN